MSEVFDNFLDDDELVQALLIIKKPEWKFGIKSYKNQGVSFWSLDLMKYHTYVNKLVDKLKTLTGRDYKLHNVYANGQTYGQDGVYHQDDDFNQNAFTLVIYINDNDGYTQIKNEDGTITTIIPCQRRAVLYNSTVIHRGLGPSRFNDKLRVTFAFRLTDITK